MPILAAGAGASEGLDTLLTRMMMEEQIAQRNRALDEETRHNKADEGLRGRQIDSISMDRADKLAEAKRALTDKTVSARGIGDQVTEDEYKTETGAGFPTGDYAIKPGAKVTKLSGFTSLPGNVSGMTGQGSPSAPVQEKENVSQEESPLNAPRLISFKGTEAQRLAREKEMQGQPVNNELKPHTTHDPGTAAALGVKVDQPFNVWANPRTRTLAMENGMPIPPQHAANLQPYERPPSPDRVLIQSGDGYMRRTDAASKLGAGQDVPLATTATTRTMEEGAKMLQPHIAKVQDLAESLDKDGLFGPVMSRVRDIAAKVGTLDEFTSAVAADPELSKDRRVGRFATSLGLLASGAGRVHGGARGGGSPQMYAAFKDLLSASGSVQMFEGRLDGLNEYMSGYAAGPNAKPEAPAAGDLYQEYLKRTTQK